MVQLDQAVSSKLYGQAITASTLMLILVLTAGVVAVIKMLTSSRGKVKIGDLTFQWGK